MKWKISHMLPFKKVTLNNRETDFPISASPTEDRDLPPDKWAYCLVSGSGFSRVLLARKNSLPETFNGLNSPVVDTLVFPDMQFYYSFPSKLKFLVIWAYLSLPHYLGLLSKTF